MARLLIACLLVRALIPLGYMPGNLLAGELMTLCPVASAATEALLKPAHSHHHHHTQQHAASITESCPIGSALQVDQITNSLLLPAVDLQVVLQPLERQPAEFRYVFPRRAPARGPPLI